MTKELEKIKQRLHDFQTAHFDEEDVHTVFYQHVESDISYLLVLIDEMTAEIARLNEQRNF